MSYSRLPNSVSDWEKEDDAEIQSHDGKPTVLSGVRKNKMLWVHVCFISLYSIAFAIMLSRRSPLVTGTAGLIYSPAEDALRPLKVLFNDDLTKLNPYRGPSRPELDEAWSSLVKFNSIRVSASDLRAINRTSVKLSDGSGTYLAGLEVHHQLHCLKTIRQYIYRDDYDLPPRHLNEHLDHCIDNLRQFVMCKADIAVQTFDWIDNNPRPFPNFKVEHECFDWNLVNEWARNHAIDIFDNKTIMHPTLGKWTNDLQSISINEEHEGVSYPMDHNGAFIQVDGKDPVEGKIITPPIHD